MGSNEVTTQELVNYRSVPQKKLAYVNKKLGNTSVLKSQDTSFQIYDTVNVPVGASTQRYFVVSAGKNIYQTNLNQPRLDSSESMVIEYLYISQDPASPSMETGNFMDMSFWIGNQQVVKNLPLTFQLHTNLAYEPFNQSAGGQIGLSFLTSIIIPPQTDFFMELRFSNLAGAQPIQAIIGGYGKLYSPNRSY